MKLSVVIPAHNEEDSLQPVVRALSAELARAGIDYEIVIVNDNSVDATERVIAACSSENPRVRLVNNTIPNGFGRAIRMGLEHMRGEAVVICMADGSDEPADVVKYYRVLEQGYDCAFGSRFIKGSTVQGYPRLKLWLNRMGNKFIQLLFMTAYNDMSNAFKGYRRHVITAAQPLVSQYFNITVELPLKALVRGFSFAVVPISWNGRTSGVSKYRIRELSRKYFFSILFVWLEGILLKEEIRATRPRTTV
jgi:dolichol-phosphate mannosyltransferase